MKKLVVFDMDGTLAASKSSLDAEMASHLHDLLGVVRDAIISGGAGQQFERRVLSRLPLGASLDRLSILPGTDDSVELLDSENRWIFGGRLQPSVAVFLKETSAERVCTPGVSIPPNRR